MNARLLFALACVAFGRADGQGTFSPVPSDQNALPTAEFRIEPRPPSAQEIEAKREPWRASIAREYESLKAELDIDDESYQRLVDILVEERIESMRAGGMDDEQVRADIVTKKLRAIAVLLGEDGLDTYHDYMATRFERETVRAFAQRLGRGHELSTEQRDQLVELLAEHSERNRRPRLWMATGTVAPLAEMTAEQRNVYGRLRAVNANEEALQRMRERNPEIVARASGFLTGAQLAELERFQRENEIAFKRRIERQRADLDPTQVTTVNEALAAASRETRAPITSDITVEAEISVDGETPTKVTSTHPNGTPFVIELPEISLELNVTLMPIQGLNLAVTYFGELGSKRRQLDNPSSGSTHSGFDDEDPLTVIRTDVVHGEKRGHVVSTTVRLVERK